MEAERNFPQPPFLNVSERVAVHAVPVGIGGEAEGSIGGLAAATATDVPAVSPMESHSQHSKARRKTMKKKKDTLKLPKLQDLQKRQVGTIAEPKGIDSQKNLLKKGHGQKVRIR